MNKPAVSIGRRVAKVSVLLGVAAVAVASTGCSTPAYSARERWNITARNADLEWKMAQDDIDRMMGFRPLSLGTDWHIR